MGGIRQKCLTGNSADFQAVSPSEKSVQPSTGGQQVTTAKADDVASGREVNWHQIDWRKAHRTVRRLQTRIAKAVQVGNWHQAKNLQRLLTHSFYGKAIAVKRVTENQGKRTPGVDGQTWSTPESKARAIRSLTAEGYKPRPLKRMYIPKANGKVRALGIPIMRDRAMQALHLLALEPISETTADPNSYGFRPMRACRDAAEHCHQALSHRHSAQWVLDADISGCFDHISHEWLIENIPMDKTILQKWLKAGFMAKGQWFPTDEGAPQGGIISPVLANMALDGLGNRLRQRFGARSSGKGRQNKVKLIRYADDFVVTGASKAILLEAKAIIELFLAERGLWLSPEKTQIAHIEEGFDFLGWNIRKYKGKLLIKPAKKNVQAFTARIRDVIRGSRAMKQETVIKRLNPIIRGWTEYHRNQVAKETFRKVDAAIWRMLWRWSTRRHPNKSRSWIKRRYFHKVQNRNWVFGATGLEKDGQKHFVTLLACSDTPIRRHVKIKREANPYDPNWEEYFEARWDRSLRENLKKGSKVSALMIRQRGICPLCKQWIGKWWNTHHVTFKASGGSEAMSNLVLLHPNCHRQLHSLINQVHTNPLRSVEA
jgi:RNA-directed DNA polymerase